MCLACLRRAPDRFHYRSKANTSIIHTARRRQREVTKTRQRDTQTGGRATPRLQLKKFNHNYQLHHRDTLVDVPLRSAGKFFILAQVPRRKESFASSCHSEKAHHVPRSPHPWHLSLYYCSLSSRDGQYDTMARPFRPDELGKLGMFRQCYERANSAPCQSLQAVICAQLSIRY